MTRDEYASNEGIKLTSLAEITDDQVISAVHLFYTSNSGVFRNAIGGDEAFAVEVFVQEDDAFDAWACTFADGDVIVISRGLIHLLLTMSRALVGDFVPSAIGESIRHWYPYGPKRLMEDPMAFRVEAPKCENQRQFSLKIFEYAMLFILNHELAHIYNGHTLWEREVYGFALRREVALSVAQPLAGLEDETIEWDADSWAVESGLVVSLRPAIDRSSGRDKWLISMSLDEVDPYPSRFLAMMIGTMLCALLIAATSEGDVLDTKPQLHPHPAIRFHLIISAVTHVLAYRTGNTMDDVGRRLNKAASLIAMSYSAAFGSDELAEEIRADETINAMFARLSAYEATWERMHPALDKLKRGNVLAPAIATPHPAFQDRETYG